MEVGRRSWIPRFNRNPGAVSSRGNMRKGDKYKKIRYKITIHILTNLDFVLFWDGKCGLIHVFLPENMAFSYTESLPQSA